MNHVKTISQLYTYSNALFFNQKLHYSLFSFFENTNSSVINSACNYFLRLLAIEEIRNETKL